MALSDVPNVIVPSSLEVEVVPSSAAVWRGSMWSLITLHVELQTPMLPNILSPGRRKPHYSDFTFRFSAYLEVKDRVLSDTRTQPSETWGRSICDVGTGRRYVVAGTCCGRDDTLGFRFDTKAEPPHFCHVEPWEEDLSNDGSLLEIRREIQAQIHQDALQAGSNSFQIVVKLEVTTNADDGLSGLYRSTKSFADFDFDIEPEALDVPDLPTFVFIGRSKPIRIVEYALAIEERFATNPNMSRHGETTTFEWYCKCGGENAGIDVVIHLKNSQGNIVNYFPRRLPLKTELVYSDGTPTPTMPKSPLRARRSSDTSKKTLFRPMRPPPVLSPRQGSHDFTFRIEEVSFHHPGYDGFKLKVSPVDEEITDVLPGILEETIVVRSKPKVEPHFRRKSGGRVIIKKDLRHCESPSSSLSSSSTPKLPTDKKKSSSSLSSQSKSSSEKKKSGRRERPRKVSVRPEDLKCDLQSVVSFKPDVMSEHFVSEEGGCLWCTKAIEARNFYSSLYHESDCLFVKSMLPAMSFKNDGSLAASNPFSGNPFSSASSLGKPLDLEKLSVIPTETKSNQDEQTMLVDFKLPSSCSDIDSDGVSLISSCVDVFESDASGCASDDHISSDDFLELSHHAAIKSE